MPNILIFTLSHRYTQKEFIDALLHEDIFVVATTPQTNRFVTHLDFTEEMVTRVDAIRCKLNQDPTSTTNTPVVYPAC
jgi:hypothetical protein